MKKKVKLFLKKEKSRKFKTNQIVYNSKLKTLTRLDESRVKWMTDASIEGHPLEVDIVNPYIIFNDPIMKDDLYFNREGELKKCVGGETNKQLKNCNKVAALPNQIPTDEDSLKKLSYILENGSEFDVEMEDEFTNPKAFENFGWGDGLPRPVLVDGKIIIN
jgi:hypothetical protein